MFTALAAPTDFSFLLRSYTTSTTSPAVARTPPLSPSISISSLRHFSKHLCCTRSTRSRLAERLKLFCSARAEGAEREAVVSTDDSQETNGARRSRRRSASFGLPCDDHELANSVRNVGKRSLLFYMAGRDHGTRLAVGPTWVSENLGSADWETARACKESGVICEGRIEGFNGGGLLVRFHSLLGFLPYPLLCPYYSCNDPNRSIQEIARDLVGSSISVKVIQVCEDDRNLILSEKDAIWSKFSGQVNVGDIFEARVGSVEDYGAFVHLRFPDGCYYLTGLVHVSEVSWDLVQDVRDILNEGDGVKVKVLQIDRDKARITLSLKQLEDDPLLETLDKVIPRVSSGTSNMSDGSNTEPLPGLESICKELLQEEGITDVKIGRKGFEKRVVSQDLELWLSNAPVEDKRFTLLARAGREITMEENLRTKWHVCKICAIYQVDPNAYMAKVQEVYLMTDLNQEDIKKAVQRVLSRVP